MMCGENKGADKLCIYCTAVLSVSFVSYIHVHIVRINKVVYGLGFGSMRFSYEASHIYTSYTNDSLHV